jgi:hypothetical protein
MRATSVLQLLIHLVHPVGRGCRQCVQLHGHRGHVLDCPSEGGKLLLLVVDHHGLPCLEHGLALV